MERKKEEPKEKRLSFVLELKEGFAFKINGEGWLIKKGKMYHYSVLGLNREEFLEKYGEIRD